MPNLNPGKHIVCCFLLLLAMHAQAQLRADFTASKYDGCPPLQVSFTNNTSGASGNVTYKWDLGNGNTPTTPNPAAIYTQEGTYTVTLTVTSDGKSSQQSKKITVHKKPTVDFSVDGKIGCLPWNATFTSNAVSDGGTIISYAWDFGDGNTMSSGSATATHSFIVVQKPTASLTVTDNYGCTNTLVKKDIVEVLPAMTSNFSSDKKVLCKVSDPVQFTNTSNGPGTLTYLWDFGDGNTSAVKEPGHAFNKKGNYTVSLTVKNAEGCVAKSTMTEALNVANYTTDFDAPPLICQNQTASFINKSTPAATSGTWLIDDVDAYNYYNSFSYNFSTVKSYKVTLKNMFENCPDMAEKTVEVRPVPVPADIKAELQTECGAPVVVKFSDATPTATQWKWQFNYDAYNNNNRIDAVTQNPSYQYNFNTNYTVKLDVGNSYGCFATTYKGVSTYPPTGYADIKSSTGKNPNSNCGPFDVTFYARISQDVESYLWNLGDGTTSTEAEPTHTYSKVGSYNVTLSYVTKKGCSGSTYVYSPINVYTVPTITGFTASDTKPCGNTAIFFTPTGTGTISKWYWDFGEGFYWEYNAYYYVTYGHGYTAEGSYTVRAIAANDACSSEPMVKTDLIKVKPPFPRVSDPETTCKGTRGDVVFKQSSVNATEVVWNFGDNTPEVTVPATQATINHTYTKTGHYQVTLTAVNGDCRVPVGESVTVYLKQTLKLELDKSSICSENEHVIARVYNYEDDPNHQGWYYYSQRFEYGDGTPYTGTKYGRNDFSNEMKWDMVGFDAQKNGLRVIMKAESSGCEDTSEIAILKVKGMAKANFEIINNKTCFQDAVTLHDISTGNGTSTIKKWTWNYGDGFSESFSTGKNTSHTYQSPGNYYATLTLTDDQNCSTTTSSSYGTAVQINGPKAQFTTSGTNVYLNATLYFYNNTINNGGYNIKYEWDFGDKSAISNEAYPNHTYTKPGTYTIKLIATDLDTKCTSSYSVTINVKDFNYAFSMTSSFVAGNGCAPLLVRFSNNSNNYTRVTWDFGDGITADNVNYPSHIYEKPGKYYVKLFVYGYNGLTGTFLDSVEIKKPSATLNVDVLDMCRGEQVKLTVTSLNAVGYSWDMGDGNLLNGTDGSDTYAYAGPGSYTPRLIIKDGNGCTGSTDLDKKITVRPDPVINITPADPMICRDKTNVVLHATGGVSYSWSPKDGSLSATDIASPTASPRVNTTYTLLVADDIGCKNQAQYMVKVAQPITVKASNDTAVCMGNPVQLNAAGASTYQWIDDTEGLSSVSIANPSLVVTKSGVYTVKGFDDHNCFTSTATVNIKAIELPTADLGNDQKILAGTSLQLTPAYSTDVVSWQWEPQKFLNCTNCPSPVITPFSQMTYKLTVTNNGGCKASDDIEIKLQCEASRISIPNVFSPNSDGNNDVFTIKGVGLIKHIIIFDRWGTKVYEKNDLVTSDRSSCWDGTNKGYPAPAGTYVYYIEIKCETGLPFTEKGTVVLVR